MKVPEPFVPFMKGMLKVSIPMTYIFMAVGAFMAIAMVVQLRWGGFFFSLLFIGFAIFHRFYCIRMLDSLERTGTPYKWRRKP